MSDATNMSSTSNISDMSEDELIYDNASVSKTLRLKESTIRKYCALMIKYGYKFHENAVGHRVFYRADIEILKEIVDLKNSTDLTLVESVKAISDLDIADVVNTTDKTAMSDISYAKLLEEFSAFKEGQRRFNEELLQQLHNQQEYIVHSLEERDKKLMLALRETMETKKEIVTSKNKKWWKFW